MNQNKLKYTYLMGYNAIALAQPPKNVQATTFASKGENLLQPEEFQGSEFALLIENLLLEKDFNISKIDVGYTREVEQGTSAMLKGFSFKGNKYFIQDDKLYVNDGTLAGNTVIHTFAATGVQKNADFAKFGDYLFACNGTEKPVRVSRTLNYDGGTVDFTVGEILTDTVTSATAVILEKTGTTVSGTLTLGSIDGTFGDNNALTDTGGGSADANGTVGWTSTIITDAKVCGGLFIYDQRLVMFKIQDNPSQVYYSQQFNPLAATPNPPFTNFTTISTPPLTTDPGSTSFSNAGEVTQLLTLGGQLVAFYADGESGIRIDTINVDTSGLRQTVQIDFQNEGLGADKAVVTRDGVYFVNEGGVWFAPIRTETAYPLSFTATKASQLFSKTFTRSLDFTGADMVYDEAENRVVITCKKGAEFNNFVLVVYPELRQGGVTPFTRMTGWYFSSFFKEGQDLFGTSSIDGKIHKLFNGESADTKPITFTFQQSLTQGDPFSLKETHSQEIKGFISEGQTITINYDIYDQEGIFRGSESTTWSLTSTKNQSTNETVGGQGKAPIGQGAIGGSDGLGAGLIEDWNRQRLGIYRYKRLILTITETSSLPCKINYLRLETFNKGQNNTYKS